jgi:hypothetical protein
MVLIGLLVSSLLGQVFQSPTPFGTSSNTAPIVLSSGFDHLEKDFGNVPHGSKQVHVFSFVNKFGKPVTILSTRSSCKCASIKASSNVAQPGERIDFEVTYDSRTFTGYRQMTLTIDMQTDHYEAVNLLVKGFSRQDVILEPGLVELGTFKIGEEQKRTVRLEYAGHLDWRVTQVIDGQWTRGTVREVSRGNGMVRYSVDLVVSSKAPRGVMRDAVQLRTNDPSSPIVRIDVNGLIDGGLEAAPSLIRFGDVKVGEKVIKKVMVKGDRPFQIIKARHELPGLLIQSTQGERGVHLVQLEWTPTSKGAVDKNIRLVTGPDGRELTLEVQGSSK